MDSCVEEEQLLVQSELSPAAGLNWEAPLPSARPLPLLFSSVSIPTTAAGPSGGESPLFSGL